MKSNFRAFYFKITALFLVVLLLIGGIYVTIASMSANQFFLQTKQVLCKNVAHQVIDDVTLFKSGELNKKGIKMVMMHHMQVNPSSEVYILDTLGKILTYDAPAEKIKMNAIAVTPVKTYLQHGGNQFILGNDPRNPGVNKIFSAAPIIENGTLEGYVYVILSSEEYDLVSDSLFNGFIYNVGKKTILITLFVGLALALLAIWYLSKNLRVIEKGVRHFADQDFDYRIPQKGEFGQLAQTINKMADTISCNIEQLRTVERLRKELVANVSHDLRTPLAIVHGYAETLVMKRDVLSKEEQLKYLNSILNSSEKLEKMVNELFELSKLESKQVQLQLEDVVIAELLSDITARYQLLAEKKKLSLKLEVEKDRAARVKVDIALIERVLQNLIENAFKFTPKGGEITLKVSSSAQTKDLRIEVIDNGKGIDEAYLPFVFDRYKKHNEEDATQGAGLGLAIVKKIIELHGTNIFVDSSPGTGTRFYFDLEPA